MRSRALRPHPSARRKPKEKTVGVIDIGSNSVRLVVYEELTRSLAPIFNEKVLCGLGRAVQTTGLLGESEVAKALTALRRFHALCKLMKVGQLYAIATAACRDATNGPAFIAKAERICGVDIEVLSGAREAKLSALGVVSGVHRPDGIVGDLGGGSLELIDVRGHRVRSGVTLPLGGLALQDSSQKSIKKAVRIVRTKLAAVPQLLEGRGRTFYAVGGTWRALARIHILQSGYPLRVMHGYSLPAASALDFVRRLRKLVLNNILADVETVTEARRPLLAYAALVLEYIILTAKPETVMFSSFGVREGLLYEMLPEPVRREDGLLSTARHLNDLRSRAPDHADDLIDWTDRFVRVAKIKETEEDRRLRHAACLLSDLGWRAHPDYRGDETLHVIANGNFGAATHEERVFLALAVYFRYAGIGEKNQPRTGLSVLLSPAMSERARLVGQMLRVGHLVSAAHPGVLPATHFRARGRKLVLAFDRRIGGLVGDRISNRFKQLARLVGRSGVAEVH
ncbi:Guanosine-5'-triphosphate,3'-diphosphate pyrophosphatase [Afipia felis]|uniref:exopolyphosphatase n=1 Tax=Afipia felis TaxID=1035 RepID=A0A090MPQ0_AFIFE|nr:exopolyphosphatase [Afipia felis]CEG08237.1 Guanosine-5'-triphosphate,3'-diphosphate pyrophosphatase [Afipia felis]